MTIQPRRASFSEDLRTLLSEHRPFEHALLKTVTLDLVGKIRNSNQPIPGDAPSVLETTAG